MIDKHNIIISTAVESDPDGFARINDENVLAPGYYWRAKEDITQHNTSFNRTMTIIRKDDVLLLVDVHEFEGVAHSVELLDPPSRAGYSTHKLMLEEFFAKMEPCHDAQAIRDREQADIMQRVQNIQTEMAQAEFNPLALPGIQEAAEKAVAEFERNEEVSVAQSQKTATERERDLRRIHRRAARRSDAAGNPLVVQNVVMSSQLSDMIDGGVTSEGLKELTLESRRRTAIAAATATWLADRAEAIGRTMKELTPYYAERAKVVLAKSKKAIRYAEEISKGLKSLELYTGDGVDVVEVRRGTSASTVIPLTLVQGKRYMAEEVAVFADVDQSFDFSSQGVFFELLEKNDALRDQVFPTSRCVVSMAVNRETVQYGEKVSAMEAAIKNARNRSVFLLVRDGDNIHVVYSGEPSHEAAKRLFPGDGDINEPFKGVDGTKINLKDVAFIKASKEFDDQALHYKRFLILLCGLDHRLHLMGEFYPPENGLQFMSLEFQSKYFHFLEDDRADFLLEQPIAPVEKWTGQCNASLRSGSRVMISSAARVSAPALNRLSRHSIVNSDLQKLHIVVRAGGYHYITVRAKSEYSFGGEAKAVKIWLDGPEAKNSDSTPHFLCLDMVRLPAIQRYIHSRVHRSHSIRWIRIFKRIQAVLERELVEQADLRQHLRANALQHGGLVVEQVDEAIEVAIATWRAGHRGAEAPGMDDTKAVHEILTLMYPSAKIAETIDGLLSTLIAEQGFVPLKLVRTGKTRLALYVEPSLEDKTPYAPGCNWGWVKRIVIEPRKTKLSVASSSLVWLQKDKSDPTEEEMRTWSALDGWLNPRAEPISLKVLEKFKLNMQEAEEVFADLLRVKRFVREGKPLAEEIFATIKDQYKSHFMSAGTYSNDAHLSIPVGVYQRNAGGAVRFLYMECRAIDFVNHYGDDAQVKELAEIAQRYRFRKLAQVYGKCEWRLAVAARPERHWIDDGIFTEPECLKAKIKANSSRKSGLYSSFNRLRNGTPELVSRDVNLSFNRAIEALVQKAPHLKRNFYANLRNEVKSAESFPDFSGDKKEKLAKLKAQKWTPSNMPVYLSSLVWNERAGRSFACRLFEAKPRG